MLPDEFYLRNLSEAWVRINHRVFGGALLIPPVFRLVAVKHVAADWCSATRMIRFSRSFLEARSWLTVLEVLKHEMAHQYVSDVLGVEDETSHGPAFKLVCERYAIDASASAPQRTDQELRAVERIKKLLALGSSANEHEAKAALRKAQELLASSGLTDADLHGTNSDEYGVAHVGEVVLRKTPESYRGVVCHILTAHFRMRAIWVHTLDMDGRSGLQLEICGRRGDVTIAEYVHGFLAAEATRLWEQTGKKGQRNRLDFLEGTMRGFLQTLDAEAKSAAPVASGLVYVTMSADLDDYFDRRHPDRENMRGSRRQRGATYGEGVSAGRKIALKAAVPTSDRKLLGAG
jgi:hypothetical protein